MTNHIEELMKAAGVKPVIRYYFYFINEEMEITKEALIQCAKAFTNLGKVTRVTREYPAFTPEKQLELIKMIGKELVSLNYRQHKDFYAMQVNSTNRYSGIYKEADTFEELLADIIVELIKLGELNKSEVKRILEDD